MAETKAKTPQSVDTTFTVPITKDNNSGWSCVVMEDSGEFFGTRRAVKISGTIDGQPFEATMLPVGGGNHMIPIKAALRKLVAKEQGDEVTVHIKQRFS
ncbi:DUF1905 domain-containing protein [Micromonospora sp. NPDC000207]|uniref:DUF1905 domain-containing protein n=1 Tax=Micromonospora sp. NPDC000207 TaxID=3154246 RepID=UPI003325CC8E